MTILSERLPAALPPLGDGPITAEEAPIGHWTDFAICSSQGELFFEPFGERPGARARREARARAVCEGCPVRLACRDAGRRNNENGIWGGETEEERAWAGFAPTSISRRSVELARRQSLVTPQTG